MTVPDRTIITEPSTKSVDEFATRISRRVRASGPGFAEVATAVRGLQQTLGHLRSEAEDPDSPLNQAGSAGRSAVYSRQLTPLLEDSDFVLKQVQAVLERYGGAEGSDGTVAGRNAHLRSDDDVQERRGKLDLLQKEVTSQRIKIDMFLDTVQLPNPARNQQVLENTDGHELDAIKDKVDAVAARLFRNRTSPVEGPDDIWQDFKVELEKEGFKSEVLRKNKEVLRAYIREVESHQRPAGGSPPSFRGLLAHGPTPHAMVPYPVSDDEARRDGHQQMPVVVPRQFDPAVPRSLQPVYHSGAAGIDVRTSDLSYQPYSSDESEDSGHGDNSMALISTKDLMAIDRREADISARMSDIHLAPGFSLGNYSVSPGTSPSTRYLPAGAQPLQITRPAGPPYDMHLSSSPISQHLGTSPRYVPPVPYPGGVSQASSLVVSPPPHGSSPPYPTGSSNPTFAVSAPPASHGPPPRQHSRLAPDSKGQEIPSDAKWTRIKRSLVSPEVLEKAGVRYEARPEFVAVLGILSRDKIAEYAKLSAEIRNARRPVGKRPETYRDLEIRRASKDSQSGDESDVLWDDSDESGDGRGSRRKRSRRDRGKNVPKGAHDKEKASDRRVDRDLRPHPIIVSPPASVNGDEASPASTVGPKPILKIKKTPHQVRFDGDGPREIAPGDYSEKSRRERDRSGHRGERERDRPRDRDKDRSHRDRDGDRDRRPSQRSAAERDRDRDRDRDRNRDRDKERLERGEREDRNKRSTLKDTFSAAGIGGAAATLLSVLADAAVHL